MKLFITGSEGFVGKQLVECCAAQGHKVTAVDLADSQREGSYKASICDPAIAQLVPEGADAIIHLAGLTRDPDCRNRGYECFQVNVLGTLNLMEAATRRSVKQFIFASTEWVYDSFAAGEVKDEDSPIDIARLNSEYALSKLVSEQNLRQKFRHGFCPVTILRFGIIYGPRKSNWSAVESLLHSAATCDQVMVGSRKTGRCFIHVRDIVAGILRSLGLGGYHLLNLQGNRLVTLGEILDLSQAILGRRVEVCESDPENASVRHVSNKAARSLLGWQPEFDMKQGLCSLLGSVVEEAA